MMRLLRTFLLLLPAIAAACSLHAQSTAAPAPGVVTVSFNAVVLQTAEAQRELAALQTQLAPRQAQIKSLNDQVENSRKQLQATADRLSDAERSSRERTLSDHEKQLQRQVEDFKNDSQSESQQIFQGIAQKVYAYLQSYAKQHSYAVVVERGSDAGPVVWYAAANLDITGELVKAYDTQSTAAPAAGPAPAGKAAQQKPH